MCKSSNELTNELTNQSINKNINQMDQQQVEFCIEIYPWFLAVF